MPAITANQYLDCIALHRNPRTQFRAGGRWVGALNRAPSPSLEVDPSGHSRNQTETETEERSRAQNPCLRPTVFQGSLDNILCLTML